MILLEKKLCIKRIINCKLYIKADHDLIVIIDQENLSDFEYI